MKVLAFLAAIAACLCIQDVPTPAAPTEQHEWLRRLVGEWKVTTEATMAPGEEPMRMESTESVRAIGGLWVVAEGKADLGGQAFQSMMTIGFDPAQGIFVGSWIDTMQSHMWTYRGTLDDEKKSLTLEAEGPVAGDPEKRALFRDVITIETPDLKRLESSIRGDDGTWTPFMKAEYRRVR